MDACEFSWDDLGGLKISMRKHLLPTALLFVAAFSMDAQSYSIDWFKVAGGGGTSSNGQYSVSGTIGQHDAGGPMSGGNYSLTGAFWALVSVAQAPGAPMLYISHSGNTVTVFWQNVTGWNLKQNNSLNTPAGWTANGYTISTNNGTNSITITPPAGNLFFLLSQPEILNFGH
jgi:hypothetical protein